MQSFSSRPSTLVPAGRKWLQRFANIQAAQQRRRPEEVQVSPPPQYQEGLLTRDFIFEALYSAQGYFGAKGSNVIISMNDKERIDFKGLRGYWDYQLELDRLYKSRKEAWLTPVEIFAPHYSNAIARYIVKQFRKKQNAPRLVSSPRERRRACSGSGHRRPQRLVIYEYGGGYGTNARCILDFVRALAPDLYANMQYTIIEISKPLANRQCERVFPDHEKVCQVVLSDALEWTKEKARARRSGGAASHMATTSRSIEEDEEEEQDDECFVIALEVFDNLPHDKVVWVREGEAAPHQQRQEGKWELHEAIVRGTGSRESPFREETRPLQDDLISLVLQVKPSLANHMDPRGLQGGTTAAGWKQWMANMLKLQKPGPRAAFVPTGMARLIEGVCQAFPRHNLIIADFDSLPPPTVEDPDQAKDLEAYNAPLVTSRDPATGAHIDHPSYVVNKGGADIFFPVDFRTLRDLHRFFAGREDRVGSIRQTSCILKSSDFMRAYASLEQTSTRSGYNPIIEDFLNTSFFLTEPGTAGGATTPMAVAAAAAAAAAQQL